MQNTNVLNAIGNSTTTTSSSTTSSTSTSSTTTTTVDCLHPIDYLFQKAAEYAELNNVTFRQSLQTALDTGIILEGCNACCPKCNYYFLATWEVYSNTDEALGGLTQQCCLNKLLSVENRVIWEEYFTDIPALPPVGANEVIYNFQLNRKLCCTNLNTCINNLISYFSEKQCEYTTGLNQNVIDIYSLFLDLGIIEDGEFLSEKSEICRILNNLITYSDEECFLNTFLDILSYGLFITCSEGTTVIASAETYLKYAEAVGVTP